MAVLGTHNGFEGPEIGILIATLSVFKALLPRSSRIAWWGRFLSQYFRLKNPLSNIGRPSNSASKSQKKPELAIFLS
jgi:hypothetical protein